MTDDMLQDDAAQAREQLVPLMRKADEPGNQADDIPRGVIIDDTHPATDSGVDPDETYQEGLSKASEANDPNRSQAPPL